MCKQQLRWLAFFNSHSIIILFANRNSCLLFFSYAIFSVVNLENIRIKSYYEISKHKLNENSILIHFVILCYWICETTGLSYFQGRSQNCNLVTLFRKGIHVMKWVSYCEEVKWRRLSKIIKIHDFQIFKCKQLFITNTESSLQKISPFLVSWKYLITWLRGEGGED